MSRGQAVLNMSISSDLPSLNDREPTADERAGMTWWSSLTETERRHWMRTAGDTGVAADAWTAYKHAQGEGVRSSNE